MIRLRAEPDRPAMAHPPIRPGLAVWLRQEIEYRADAAQRAPLQAKERRRQEQCGAEER